MSSSLKEKRLYMKTPICPYNASNNGTCSHKESFPNKKGKRYCDYEYPYNCDLFLKWLDIKQKAEKSKIKGLKSPQDTIK